MKDFGSWRLFAAFLIGFGILAKFYGINDPWKTHDHYNFGGVWTTTYAECLKSTPLSISKGIPHQSCWKPDPVYYRAHPPTILFAMWGWTSVFGSAEWSYRLFVLFFSCMNIGWVFLIGRETRAGPLFPWLAAGLQSVFLGNMYFGTHLDFISEFTVFFCLMTAWLALRGWLTAACFAGLAAGVSAWPGYIVFAPLWAYTWMIGRGRKRVFLFGCLGFALALATMMWLHQTTDIVAFLREKLLSPGYVKKEEKGVLEPLRFLVNVIKSFARLLSPVLAAFAVYELSRGRLKSLFTSWRSRWKGLSPVHHATWLAGGTGLVYALIGHEYFMVHVFLYLLLTPGLAFAGASFLDGLIRGEKVESRAWMIVFALLFASLYPYGIFKSNPLHDAITSAILALSALALVFFAARAKLTPRVAGVLVAIAALGNFSQLMNYRNEPDTERSFCEKAREEYGRTGQPIHTKEPQSSAKDFLYCRGIPIQYDSP